MRGKSLQRSSPCLGLIGPAVLQRVKSASVTVDGQLISSIGKGVLILAAVSRDDTEKDVEFMASKILKTKLWDDDSKDPPSRVSGSAHGVRNLLT
jgi:D-tyrosyl-tRNA(Tyr) deacylase